MTRSDLSTGPRGIPNSSCWERIPEGELTEYKFNSCGYRAGMECGPKQPGTYRIVMIGTSFVTGMRVPREKTFAALLPLELSRRTGLKVEIYNEAIPYRFADTIALHFDEILKAQPDLILWPLTNGDIEWQSWAQSVDDNRIEVPSFFARARQIIKTSFATKSFSAALTEIFRHTRTATLLLGVLYASPTEYVKSSLMETGNEVGYERSETSAELQRRLDKFDNDDAKLEAEARDANVPLVAVMVPNHVQANIVSMGELPAGYDPYRLDDELRAMVTGHGGIYIDIFPDIRSMPSLQRGYFPIDGHPNAMGHAIISSLLAKELTSGVIPALKDASQKPTARRQGN